MITNKLFKLPPFIIFEGITFEFRLFIGQDEIRLSYDIAGTADNSKHLKSVLTNGCWDNPFTDHLCAFLYLYEGIMTDKDLEKALNDCYSFIKKYKLND